VDARPSFLPSSDLLRRQAVRLQLARWHWLKNFDRTFRHTFDRRDACYLEADLHELRTSGIILRRSAEMFDADGLALLGRIRSLINTRMQGQDVQAALHQQDSGVQGKEYRLHLLDKEIPVESPFIQLGIQPRLLSLVNAYLGMRSYLRAVVVWLDFPTAEPAKETQLWHRDADDTLNLKLFVYLSDVDEGSGPFCFIPRTHPLGRRYFDLRATGRVTDEVMAGAIDRSHWQVCTGDSDTVILVDTRGYHKGLKPSARHRVLLQFHYTSGTVPYPRDFALQGTVNGTIDARQRYALCEA